MVGHNALGLVVHCAVIGMDHGDAHQDVVQGALAPLERVLHAVLLKRHHLHRDLRILQPTLLHDQPNAADARLQAVGAPLQQIVVAEGPGRRVARPSGLLQSQKVDVVRDAEALQRIGIYLRVMLQYRIQGIYYRCYAISQSAFHLDVRVTDIRYSRSVLSA